jgi:hypothetical protein
MITVCAAAILFVMAGLATGQSLPANHPRPEGGAPQGLPPGHPPMGGAGGMSGAMPPGHPPLAPTTAPAKGSITIRALEGRAGGGPITNAQILVELYHQGIVLQKWDAQLNAEGVATISDIPVRVPCQPLVTVTFKGLRQQAVGPVLTPSSPTAAFDMKVYEGTEERPAYTVAMRHVIVKWAENAAGILVTEMLSVSNPADHAWIGDKREGEGGGRSTFGLPVPAGAQEVQLMGGFDEDSALVTKEGIVSGSPLFPGQTRFQVGYAIPAHDGAVNLTITAPADVGQMMVFVPAEGATIAATGLSGGQPMSMGEEAVRAYQASGIKKGQTVSLAITGLTAAATAPGPAAAEAAKGFSARNVAIGGGVLLALCGVGVLLLKKPKPASAPAGDSDAKSRRNAGKMKR